MRSNDMSVIALALFPDATLVEEGGEYTIVTGIIADETVEPVGESQLIMMAERLCGGVIEFDQEGQAIIYTGFVDPEYAEEQS
jgi:hypothetical protein